jgi:hypothetical protein
MVPNGGALLPPSSAQWKRAAIRPYAASIPQISGIVISITIRLDCARARRKATGTTASSDSRTGGGYSPAPGGPVIHYAAPGLIRRARLAGLALATTTIRSSRIAAPDRVSESAVEAPKRNRVRNRRPAIAPPTPSITPARPIQIPFRETSQRMSAEPAPSASRTPIS